MFGEAIVYAHKSNNKWIDVPAASDGEQKNILYVQIATTAA